MSFIYKYETSRGFIKGVSGGCFVLINKLFYPQSAFTHNPGPTTNFDTGFEELIEFVPIKRHKNDFALIQFVMTRNVLRY